MKLEEINPQSLKSVDNEELAQVWHRLNQWYANAINEHKPTEDIINAAMWALDEMQARGFDYDENSELVHAIQSFKKSEIVDYQALPDEVVVVYDFVSVVGSSVKSEDYNDVDILVRANLSGGSYLVDYPNVFLPIRNAIAKDKQQKLHLISNPQGAHSDYMPLYDLILRKKKQPQIKVLKSDYVMIDLGCGNNKPNGYIGIDKDSNSNADIIHNIELGLPFANNSVDKVRAYHLLEHLPDKDFIMREIYRVLKNGGTFEFEIPSADSDGAVAHPEHKTLWNVSSFAFYTNPQLIEDRPMFEVIELAECERNGHKYVKGILRKPLNKADFKPFIPFTPPKPAMAWYTELSPQDKDKLLEWADSQSFAIEPKYNGFRAIIEKQGIRIRMWFEGSQHIDRFKSLIYQGIKNALLSIPEDFILDCDVGITKNGERLPRIELMKLNSDNPQLEENEKIEITLFDIPYFVEPLIDKPFEDRRKILEEFYKKYKNKIKEWIKISDIKYIKQPKQLNDNAIKWAFDFSMSEGLVAKKLNSTYSINGSTNDWAKMKKVAELKVIVLDKASTKTEGTYNYTVGLIDTLSFSNTIEFEGKKYVNLGNTFNTDLDVSVGSILTIELIELIMDETKNTLVLLGGRVVDVDTTRHEPYTDEQAIDIARRYQVLQIKKSIFKMILLYNKLKKLDIQGEEDTETRGEIAQREWEKNWITYLPKNGKGKFVYQHHWRGLNEEEIKLSDDELMNSSHSVHGDLRFESDNFLFGFSVFLGTTKDNKKVGGDRLVALDKTKDNLQGTFKLKQPIEWLHVGEGSGQAFAPMMPGSTSKTYSKFFVIDNGEYELGVVKQHFVEIFFNGKKLKGRYTIQSVPKENEERYWIINKPDEQTPYAQSYELQAVAEEEKAKGYEWLYWRSPMSKKTKIIDLKKLKTVNVKKIDNEKHLVYGVVLEPSIDEFGKLIAEPDTQGDVITAEEIEKAAHEYIINSRIVGENHSGKFNAQVVESYIAPVDFYINKEKIRKGSWVLVVHVPDDADWARIKNGEFNAFSIGGIGERKKL